MGTKLKNYLMLIIAGLCVAMIFAIILWPSKEPEAKPSESQPQVQWLSGTEPPYGLGNDGDYYIDTDDNLLYKKNNGVWHVIMADFGAQGNPGNDGKAPTVEISDDGYWVINGKKSSIKANAEDGDSISVVSYQKTSETESESTYTITFSDGSKASFVVKNGKDGAAPTISIDEKGSWVINGVKTDWSTIVKDKDLAEKLSSVIELATTVFEPQYEAIKSYYNYDSNSTWSYSNLNIAGYSGVIGNPEEISAIRFKIRKNKNATSDIAKIQVELKEVLPLKAGETESVINVVASADLQVNFTDVMAAGATEYDVHEVIWSLDDVVENKNNAYYILSYRCFDSLDKNVFIDLFGAVGGYGQIQIPADAKTNYTGLQLQYYSSTWLNASGSMLIMLPVQVGTVKPIYKLTDSIINDMMTRIDIVDALYTNDEITLPSTIYGYVGQNIEIYFNAISAYSATDVRVKVSSSKGNSYSDKWIYTPTAIETFDLTVSLYSRDYKLINKKTINVIINEAEEKETTVLIIGDSTVSNGDEISKMLSLANADGNNEITFIGTKGESDVKHEGRSGWKLSEYLGAGRENDKNPFYNESTSKLDFANYMDSNNYEGLDVVFIQLGINDLFSIPISSINDFVKTYIDNMQALIDAIHAYDSDIKVIINPVFPCCQDQDKFGDRYGNQTIWEYMLKAYTVNINLINVFDDADNINVSYFNASIDTEANVPNDVHPSTNGYQQLGEQMYYYMKSILV